MKTYVLMVSRRFPKNHKRAGQQTFFIQKILQALYPIEPKTFLDVKLHTVRGNYKLWEKRAKEINKGKAVLSVRYWEALPYKSKQIEFLQIFKIGLQKLDNPTNFVFAEIDGKKCNWQDIAQNDGLSFEDFNDWFKVRQNSPMAIIHFTDFNY